MPDQEDVAAAGGEREGVERAAAQLRGGLGLEPERLAGEPAVSAARTLGLVRQASMSAPSAASACPAARAWRSPFAVRRRAASSPLAVLGIAVPEQIDHFFHSIPLDLRLKAAISVLLNRDPFRNQLADPPGL